MSRSAETIRALIGDDARVPARRSLSDEAADALRELILLEKLKPGTPVPERDLAEALGVSRTPLKDALRMLAVEGLIEYGPTRRPRVADPSFEELTQYIAVQRALEALAGETACRTASDAEISSIVALEAEMRAKSDTLDPISFFHLDMRFHRAIVAAARNAPLDETHRQYNARLWRARFLSSRQDDRRDNTLDEHRRIVEALAARDAATTAAALSNHLDSTVTNISRVMARTAQSHP